MKHSLVSIVVPIYNTEKYLDRCIESIAKQTWPYLEILLIDDGSTDRSSRICDEWAEKDSRIRVFHKENEGQGIARNLGIEYARGDYICFFDSDDYIAPEMIEKMLAAAEKTDSELVVCGFHTVSAAGEILTTFLPDTSVPRYSGSQVQEQFLPDLIAPDFRSGGERRFYMSVCMMLFSMNRIRRSEWRFVSERDIISEDVYSLLQLLRTVQSVAVCPEAFYHYCENQASFSRSYRPGRYEKIRHFYLESSALCRRLGYGDTVQDRLTEPFLSYTVVTLKQEVAAPLRWKERVRVLSRIASDETLREVMERRKGTELGTAQRILFLAVRHQWIGAVFLLTWLQNLRKRLFR